MFALFLVHANVQVSSGITGVSANRRKEKPHIRLEYATEEEEAPQLKQQASLQCTSEHHKLLLLPHIWLPSFTFSEPPHSGILKYCA